MKLPISNIKKGTHGFHQFVIKAKKRDELRNFYIQKKSIHLSIIQKYYLLCLHTVSKK